MSATPGGRQHLGKAEAEALPQGVMQGNSTTVAPDSTQLKDPGDGAEDRHQQDDRRRDPARLPATISWRGRADGSLSLMDSFKQPGVTPVTRR